MEFTLDEGLKRRVSNEVGNTSAPFRKGLLIGACCLVAAPAVFVLSRMAAGGYAAKTRGVGDDFSLQVAVALTVVMLVFVFVFAAAGRRASQLGLKGRKNERLYTAGNYLVYEYFDRENYRFPSSRGVVMVDMAQATWHLEKGGRVIVFDHGARSHLYLWYGDDPMLPYEQMEAVPGVWMGLYWSPDPVRTLEAARAGALPAPAPASWQTSTDVPPQLKRQSQTQPQQQLQQQPQPATRYQAQPPAPAQLLPPPPQPQPQQDWGQPWAR